MRYIPVTCEQRERMLGVVGLSEVEQLFSDIPGGARIGRPLDLGPGLSEIELAAHMRELARSNATTTDLVSFAGSGCYDHYVPAVVDHVLRRPEFFTAYTPYQPEVSQGTLQAMYEYQTMVCELTRMDVSNASMYDGATAAVEAVLMACRSTRRSRVVVSGHLDAQWLEVLRTYELSGAFELDVLPRDGRPATDLDALARTLDRRPTETAAVLIASPNRFGVIESVSAVDGLAHDHGAFLVVATNPVLLGVMQPPGAQGADVVVAEGQSLGNAQSFGGPGLGVFATRTEHLRQMPGRLVGRTKDVDGRDAFVLTLSTREQHIRRERATSNICSNHALNALAAGAYLSAVGRRGLEGIATACVAKAHHLRDALVGTGCFESPWEAPFGHEFALRYRGDARVMIARLLEQGFLAGVYDEEADLVVFAVTEKRTRAQLDAFAKAVASL